LNAARARRGAWRVARRVAVGLSLAAAATACGGGSDGARMTVAVGAPVPAYSAQLTDGTPVSLAEQTGDVVLLNIWATWCKPCRFEMPALDSLQQRYGGDGFRVLGVSIDADGDRAKVSEYAAALGARYAIWYDPDDRVSTTFLALGVPASYLIGRDGTLRWRHVGPVTADDGGLNAAIKVALAEADSTSAASASAPPVR